MKQESIIKKKEEGGKEERGERKRGRELGKERHKEIKNNIIFTNLVFIKIYFTTEGCTCIFSSSLSSPCLFDQLPSATRSVC